MSPSIVFDMDKCTACGLCAKECSMGVIRMDGDKPKAYELDWCNKCSHCVAICPAGAITNNGLQGREAIKITRDKLDADCYGEIVMSRRSVRWYRDEPLDKAEIEEILDLANYSPTASNSQDVGYSVITDRELIRRTSQTIFKGGEKLAEQLQKPWGGLLSWYLDKFMGMKNVGTYMERYDYYKQIAAQGRDMIAHNAPVLILIHGPKDNRFANTNCAIAATNITNYAQAKGLGTCYIGFITAATDRSKKLSARLGIPPDRKAHIALTLGKPVHKFPNTTIRPKAKVTWK